MKNSKIIYLKKQYKKIILLILALMVLIIFWKPEILTFLAFILSGPIGPDDPNVAAILSTYPEFRTAEWDWTSDCISIVKPEGYEGEAYSVNLFRFICVGTFYYSENPQKYFIKYKKELEKFEFKRINVINETYFRINNIKDHFMFKKNNIVVYAEVRGNNTITVVLFYEDELNYLNRTFFFKRYERYKKYRGDYI